MNFIRADDNVRRNEFSPKKTDSCTIPRLGKYNIETNPIDNNKKDTNRVIDANLESITSMKTSSLSMLSKYDHKTKKPNNI